MERKTPQLRVVVIPYCNLHCIYCTPEGEGYGENLKERMTREEIAALIRICAEVGITHVKFTGGEPTMRSDTVDIIRDTRQTPGIEEIQMVTNGTMLVEYAAALRDVGLDILTVSIDAADQRAYEGIRGTSLTPVLEGIQKCRDVGLPVRINSVIMRMNLNQITPLMNLARQLGASLKLLDLIDLKRPGVAVWWREQFVHFRKVRRIIEKEGAVFVGYEEAPGGIGAPLLDFRTQDGLQVVLKDSTKGAYYNATFCSSCPFFPCQDAQISLRVTHDGHLKRCLIRNDNLVDVLTPLRQGESTTVRRLVQECFHILTGSKFYPNTWYPELYLNRETATKGRAPELPIVDV